LVVYSVYILLRGHNEPGGGFIGGLLLALGLIIRSYIYPNHPFKELIKAHFPALLGALMLMFLCVIVLPTLLGMPLLKGLWTSLWVPIAGKFSSVLIFDVIVYFVVALSSIYAHWTMRSAEQEETQC